MDCFHLLSEEVKNNRLLFNLLAPRFLHRQDENINRAHINSWCIVSTQQMLAAIIRFFVSIINMVLYQ